MFSPVTVKCHVNDAISQISVAGSTTHHGIIDTLTEVFTPRRQCMNYEPDVIWLHVVSDVLIACAYYSIPLALVYFVRRRRDIAFNWMFYMFAAFILACGTTHVFGVLDIWKPYYRIDGLVKAGTAGISLVTAVMLWPLIPKALAMPSPEQLRKLNVSLAREVEDRRVAQEQLARAKEESELHVRERTAELVNANRTLGEEIETRKRTEEELRANREEMKHASRMKDEFLATLSHELRTPLNAILGWAQLLRRGPMKESETACALETIERNARSQAQLIEDLLDMSRIVSGRVRLDVQRVDLAGVIDSAITTLTPASTAKGIRIQKVVDPLAGPIMGDPNRLQQVIWNLLSNAIKFTHSGGRVQVLLERVNSHVELTIIDSGQGIDPEFLPFLFERFSQGDASTTRRHGGLGLGLSIVKHLVELHGGSIRAKSPGVGKGSTFNVILPVAAVRTHDEDSGDRAHPTSSGLTAVQQPMPSLKGVRVAVVDDEPDARDLIFFILANAGAEANLYENGADALLEISRKPPDVIVSDLGMPQMDGYDFIQRVRAMGKEAGASIPAVALSAFARAEDRTRALISGYQAHLAKPVDAAELVASLASLAGRGRQS